MGTWHTVLDEQLDLLRMWKSPLGAEVAEMFGESMRRVEAEYGTDALGDVLSKQLRHKMIETLVHADPFFVDEHMMTLVEAAAESFQAEEFHETDLITPNAFVVLPKPLHMIDRNGKDCAFRAIAWTKQVFVQQDGSGRENGILLSLYTHNIEDTDDRMLELDEESGSREWRYDVSARLGSPYSLLHVTPWPFGQTPAGTIEEQENRQGFWRPVQAFMRLTLQTITDRYQQKAPRGSAKRWKRYELPERPITVVRLRRPRQHNKEAEGGPVEWSHQWIVNGHWRNQWYPSLGLYRQIFISPYTKGPEDAPLLVKHGRAFEFVK